MNADQIKQVLAPLLAMAGGYFVGKGTFTVDQWGQITEFATKNGPAIVGFVIMVFAWFKNRDSAKVATVAAMPAEAKAAAVATLPVAAQVGLAAALPDKAVLTAAGAMEGVSVTVAPSASDGAKAAAHDSNVKGVNPKEPTT